jgi:hypothetical protein
MDDNQPNPSLDLDGEGITSIPPNPVNDLGGSSGVTTYNRVKGHFFLSSLPEPQDETITRTVQGLADRFETTHEDTSVGSIVSLNDNVQITETVYQGEALSVVSDSKIATFRQTAGPNHKQSAIVVQGGYGFNNGLANTSSTADSIIAIALDDIPSLPLGITHTTI